MPASRRDAKDTIENLPDVGHNTLEGYTSLCTSNGDGDPVIKKEQEVSVVLHALASMSVHIVDAGSDKRDSEVLASYPSGSLEDDKDPSKSQNCEEKRVSPEDSPIPSGCVAVVVLVDPVVLARYAAEKVVRDFATMVDLPPLIAVLLCTGASTNTILGYTAALLEAGVDDVVVQPSNLLDLPTLLNVGICKAERHYTQLMCYEKELSENIDTHNQLFWKLTPMVWNCLPALDMNVLETLNEVGHRSLTNFLGKGHCGRVYRAINTAEGGREEAIKIVAKRDIKELRQVGAFCRETSLLKKLDHPNIVKAYDFIHARYHVYLCLEYAGRTLASAIRSSGKFSSADGRGYFKQVASGIAFVHQNGIGHRDIKPENIAITELGQIKILDFDLAVECAHRPQGFQENCGTMPFMAPEVVLGPQYQPTCSDVWSMGVLLLEMLCGLHTLSRLLGWTRPQPSKQFAEQLVQFFEDSPQFAKALGEAIGSKDAGSVEPLLLGMLSTDPAARLSSAEVLAHAWLLGDSIDSLMPVSVTQGLDRRASLPCPIPKKPDTAPPTRMRRRSCPTSASVPSPVVVKTLKSPLP